MIFDGRRRRGLERTGSVRLDRLGLTGKHGKRLQVGWAWASVAGEAIARRIRATGVKRGVLELEVDSRVDAGWLETLAEVVPRLAGRVAGRHEELGIRRFRLQMGDDAAAASSQPVTIEDDPPIAPPEERESPTPPVTEAPAETGDERLERLMERYLRRAAVAERDQNP